MNHLRNLVIIALLTVLAVRTVAAPAVRTARELASAVYDQADVGREFDITATCTKYKSARLTFKDGSGAMIADDRLDTTPKPRPGDTIRLVGRVRRGPVTGRTCAECSRIDILSHGPAPAPLAATGPEVVSGKFDFQILAVTGEVLDVFSDETDPEFVYLQLNCQGARILAPTNHDNPLVRTNRFLFGARVEISGLCEPAPFMEHWRVGRIVKTDSGCITLLSPPTADLFDVPELGDFRRMQPEEISRLGRHRTSGRVLTRWNENRLLLRTAAGQLVTVELTAGNVPDCGTDVDVVGFPETDLYNLSLIRANWRPASAGISIPSDLPPTNISVRAIIADSSGRARFNAPLHGRAIRLRGTVRNLPAKAGPNHRVYVECDGTTVPVDISAAPTAFDAVELGSDVAVSGVCIMETRPWRPNADFSNILGFVLTVRTPSDVCVLSTPPWWNQTRLLIALASLILLFLAVLAWNLSLHRLAERRGQELTRACIARAESDIKTMERTRLALELHDSIAQNLTSVTMEIDTANQYTDGVRPELTQHLAQATRTLKSCRNEVRNCLWDLRSNALEEPDFARAIRLTLLPYVKDTEVIVRFPVPRTRITDNTTHEILRIIRELVLNGIHHGGATQIKIAGSIEDDRLKFSVQDNGCGYDPATAPGVREGHFGLQGIRERVLQLDGQLVIRSEPGKGTKTTINLWAAGEGRERPS